MTVERTIIRVYIKDEQIGSHATGTAEEILMAIGTVVANAGEMLK